MRTKAILLWPFELVWGVARLVVWPVLVVGVAYFVLPDRWFVLVAVVAAIYVLVVLRLWSVAVHGQLRSMARGTVRVRERVRKGRS